MKTDTLIALSMVVLAAITLVFALIGPKEQVEDECTKKGGVMARVQPAGSVCVKRIP